ncbi:MAG: hypothetical protein ISS94_04875 [Candidatus Syntrophoarchaeum sp.]|nr:hypothetical protein [Candidatus Syntrophoarchaeum sp.]
MKILDKLIMCYDHSYLSELRLKYENNKVKWCVENGMGKEEIRIVTGMKAHLIDEYFSRYHFYSK